MMSIYGRTHHFIPADAISSFSLTPMIIRQSSEAPTPQLYSSVTLKMLQYSYVFQVDEVRNSQKWEYSVYENWADYSTSLPWQSRITPDVRSRANLVSTFETLIIFHKFHSRGLPHVLVKFGITGADRLWCHLVLDRPLELSGTNLEYLRRGGWELGRRYLPHIPVDRGSVTQSVTNGSALRVSASIRELGGDNIVVKVRIY
jgi:hypothetical protein